MPALHQMDPTGRFSSRADDYVRYRPTYPAAAIDAIFDGLPPASTLTVADIGAGTGISARLLAARGAHVIALEPNAEMRARSEPDPRINWQAGTAEATGLAENSVDVIVCAQAFHWFDPLPALREFHRILKPKGRLALVWNRRDGRDAFTNGYREAIIAVAPETPPEAMPFDPDDLPRSGCFPEATRREFPHIQELDSAGLLGRARSASYVPGEGPAWDQLTAELTRLHARCADASGHVRLQYLTEVWRTQKPA